MRLFPNEAMEENEAEYYQPPVKRTKAEELNDILSKYSGIGSTAIQTLNILNHIKKEMMFFEATQECPKYFKRLKNCLDTFPPSSVEAEYQNSVVVVSSVIEWLKCWTCDQHSLSSKPTCTILLCPWERHFGAHSPAWWSWQAVLNYNHISIKLQADSNNCPLKS